MSGEGVKERPPRPSPPETSGSVSATPAQEFEHTYREAYKLIDKGIILVTEGHKTQAGFLLHQGLALIDKALSMKVEGFNCSAEKIQLYAEMQIKMRCTRKEVLSHFADTQSGGGDGLGGSGGGASEAPSNMPEPPPSYDDYLKSIQSSDEGKSSHTSTGGGGGTTSGATITYPTLDNLNAAAESGVTGVATPIMSPQQGEMIFKVENGVQIFFIYPDGRVTSPSYPAFLAVFTFPEPIGGRRSSVGSADNNMSGARGFLQVGEWNYPLVPAHSPVLHSFYGAYMFPDVTSGVEGTSVGVILPDTVDKDMRQLFEEILTQMTQYQEQTPPPGVDVAKESSAISTSTSERIAEGAEAVSKGVVWGAGKLSELITYGSESLKTQLQPELEKREIDPKWHKTAKVARNVSGTAVRFSGYILGQVGKATMALGRRVAPQLQHHGTRAISHITGQDHKNASANMDGVMEVAAGAVRGASTLYMSLEEAAGTLAKSLTDNTVNVVTHKYGEEAGCLTDNTLYAVGQTALAGHNIASFGVKGVAKRAAKDTGRALVHHHEAKKGLEKGKDKVEEAEEVAEEVMEGVEEGKEAREDSQPPKKPVRENKKPPL